MQRPSSFRRTDAGQMGSFGCIHWLAGGMKAAPSVRWGGLLRLAPGAGAIPVHVTLRRGAMFKPAARQGRTADRSPTYLISSKRKSTSSEPAATAIVLRRIVV